MFVLVSYDVTHTKTRTRIARALEAYGERVQYSVFECQLTPVQFRRLYRRLERLVREAPDEVRHTLTIRFYHLCARCDTRITVLGHGSVSRDPTFYLA